MEKTHPKGSRPRLPPSSPFPNLVHQAPQWSTSTAGEPHHVKFGTRKVSTLGNLPKNPLPAKGPYVPESNSPRRVGDRRTTDRGLSGYHLETHLRESSVEGRPPFPGTEADGRTFTLTTSGEKNDTIRKSVVNSENTTVTPWSGTSGL